MTPPALLQPYDLHGLAFGFHKLGEPMTLADFRQVFRGTLMGNCGYTFETATQAVAEGAADLIAFGRSFPSSPTQTWSNGSPTTGRWQAPPT